MVKHFCDMCGRAVFLPQNVSISFESRGGTEQIKYDVCAPCSKKLSEHIKECGTAAIFDTSSPLKITITEVSEDCIRFSNGSVIECECDEYCANNYADFVQLDDVARAFEFNPEIVFEPMATGFLFGNEGSMFFVPCYSEQNGYYSKDVTILYNGKPVFSVDGELIED